MKKQTFKIISALIILCGIIFLMITYPEPIILSLILLSFVIKNWRTVKLISITVALSFLLGSLIFLIINLTYNGFTTITFNGWWPMISLFVYIYALGIIIEEDCQKPYIWIWKQIKKTFRKPILLAV